MTKRQTSIRLADHTFRQLEQLVEWTGLTKTGAIELSIHTMYQDVRKDYQGKDNTGPEPEGE